MNVKVKGDTTVYTLLTIVSDTMDSEKSGTLGGKVREVRAVAYVYGRDKKIKKFLADDLQEIEK